MSIIFDRPNSYSPNKAKDKLFMQMIISFTDKMFQQISLRLQCLNLSAFSSGVASIFTASKILVLFLP
jgi:hypothetical protein